MYSKINIIMVMMVTVFIAAIANPVSSMVRQAFSSNEEIYKSFYRDLETFGCGDYLVSKKNGWDFNKETRRFTDGNRVFLLNKCMLKEKSPFFKVPHFFNATETEYEDVTHQFEKGDIVICGYNVVKEMISVEDGWKIKNGHFIKDKMAIKTTDCYSSCSLK